MMTDGTETAHYGAPTLQTNGIHENGTNGTPAIYDVIIIGGGISGLVAAQSLTKLGWKVLILEARDRLGGRVWTYELDGDGHKADLGASYIHGMDGNPIAEVAEKLGMELRFYGPEPGILRDHTGAVPPDDLKIFENTSECMFSHLKALSQTSPHTAPTADIPLIAPFLSATSPLFDGLTSATSKQQATALARSYAGWCGADLGRVSFKWWGFEQDTQGRDGLVASGYWRVVEWLEGEVVAAGTDIRLGEEVVGVDCAKEQSDRVTVTTTLVHGPAGASCSIKTYTGRYALITLPLGVLQNRPPKFTPPLPQRRIEATHRLGNGLLNKVIIYYDAAWWTDIDSIYFLPDPDHPGNLLGRPTAPAALHIHNLWTLQKTPAICFFVTGYAAEKLEKLSDPAIEQWATAIIQQYLSPTQIAPRPKQVLTTRWLSDPYTLGAYSYIPITAPGEPEATPLDMLEMSHCLWGMLFFAGEHTEPDQYASVHAAWTSGVREARKLKVVLQAADDKRRSLV
ncbi:amine oxidase [Calocera cornea HHB12733]|uniref:Amine oxidase n=1 Tax=Calocera cornea HHB12733 TaxID=1353952 RepID=A0A165C6D7_9BASI|nr:amine oxidase [Calocera cornea HHB12733]